MQTEYEIKILDIDVDSIVSKLEALGAEKIAERFQRRYVYDFSPKKNWSRVRLRTDGNITTLAIKEVHNNTIEWTKELEVEVDSFETTYLILEKLGYQYSYYQENKRISYKLDDAEIEIDFRPQIPAYLEIESDSAEKVKAMTKKLGLDFEKAKAEHTQEVYQKYGLDLHAMRELKFEE